MSIFIYPTVERVTSHFRSNRKNHHGVDFAQSGYHEIKAVASGTVSRSYSSTSYGECIMIVHNVDGVIYESVYAHMRKGSRKVYEGQTIKKGQVIGVMGNTGDSSGQHLHFELHKGRWNINKSNAVDPLDYLGKKVNKTVSQMADEVIRGKHGTGHKNRKKSLGVSQNVYDSVVREVNFRLSGNKNIKQMADEVIQGKHGNGHKKRMESLGIGYDIYKQVKDEVNSRFK